MTLEERAGTTEEWLMRLRVEHDQLDRVIQAQARAIAGLQQRIERLEQQLERLRTQAD